MTLPLSGRTTTASPSTGGAIAASPVGGVVPTTGSVVAGLAVGVGVGVAVGVGATCGSSGAKSRSLPFSSVHSSISGESTSPDSLVATICAR